MGSGKLVKLDVSFRVRATETPLGVRPPGGVLRFEQHRYRNRFTAGRVRRVVLGLGKTPWRVKQTSIGTAHGNAWSWRAGSETPKRGLRYPIWHVSGCGWRTSTKTREKWAPPSSSNSRFSPRKIGRATAGLRTKKAPTRPGLQVDRRRKSPEGQISGPPEDSLKREACNPKKIETHGYSL